MADIIQMSYTGIKIEAPLKNKYTSINKQLLPYILRPDATISFAVVYVELPSDQYQR